MAPLEGERRSRGVYIAHDMAEYLIHQVTLRETAGGKLDKELGALCQPVLEASQTDGLSDSPNPDSMMPVELQALLNTGSSAPPPWATTIELDGLGLPTTILMKVSCHAYGKSAFG